jgi:hypothetical protein
MTQKHPARGRARLTLAALLTAVPLATTIVGGAATVTPVAAAITVPEVQAATADHSGDGRRDRDHRDHHHRRECDDRQGGLLGLLVELLVGSERDC